MQAALELCPFRRISSLPLIKRCQGRLGREVAWEAQRWYLDDLAAGLFQGSHLLAQGQGQLVGLGLAGDVFAGEGPVQDGHRACKQPQNMTTYDIMSGIICPVEKH